MKSGSEDPIGAIAQDRSGTLWVGSDRAGLLRRRPRQTQLEYIPDTSGTIWSIREDLHGNVWVATKSHGLLRFSGESQVRFTTKCGLASNMVYETAQVANGNIWVATEEGLSRIRDGKCASLLAANGLPPGRVIAIASDARGTLWLKTVTAVVAVKITEADRD